MAHRLSSLFALLFFFLLRPPFQHSGFEALHRKISGFEKSKTNTKRTRQTLSASRS
jgi:hypothetical protein